jgi:hypothetical protein
MSSFLKLKWFISSKKRKSQDVSARRRKMQEKSKVPWGYIIPAIIILAVIIGVIYIQTRSGATPNPLPPYASQDYVSILGPNFACVTSTLEIHIHPWLQIWINGKNVTIPSGIGITDPAQVGTVGGEPEFGANGNGNTCFEPMHTHDDSGLIHIESATDTNYTLGEFFTDWNLTYTYAIVNGIQHPIVFNQTDILGYKVNSSSDSLKLLVDGTTPPSGDFSGSSSNFGNLVLNLLDYCSSSQPANSFPCYPTDATTTGAIGDPYWLGATGFVSSSNPNGYPYGGNHTIVIEYSS